MLISTRGRYALRIIIDLAENEKEGLISLKTLADRQHISKKYLEKILPLLVSKNFVEGVQGKAGGYRLTKRPEEYRIGDILRLTEGDLAPVACLECDAPECDHKEDCRTFPLWSELDKRVTDYLDSVTISDLMKHNA